MSLQVCHCGWSKVTTYHGLRTHQGKMGCTSKGMSISDDQQFRFKSSISSINLDTDSSDKSLQVCHCGWSKVTTYHGLRTHQGKMGCTSKGMSMKPFGFESPTTRAQAKTEREEKEETKKLLKAQQGRMRAEFQQKIQTRKHKVDKVIFSANVCLCRLKAEWQEIDSVFSEVMKVVENARQKALQPLEERRRKVNHDSQALVQELENEIDQLKTAIAELDRDPDMQLCPLTGLDESNVWKNVNVDISFGTLTTTTSATMKEIEMKLQKLSRIELERIPKFAVDVKLDPATAHPCLDISDDGKKVKDGQLNQRLPHAPGRFDMFGSVLAFNGLTCGKSYWEVDVSNKTGWDLGVARGNANRKGALSLKPDNGYWVTVHYENKGYAALAAPPVSLSLKDKPKKVGVFVDYEEGLVSFYDLTNESHIYSFTQCSFSGEIFPYFSPHLGQNGKNLNPLIISTVRNH